MCGASRKSVMTDGSEWCKEVMDEAYIPIPFLEEKLKLAEWDVLAVKAKPDIPIPSKKDERAPTEKNEGLATLGVKDVAESPIPSQERKVESRKDVLDKNY